MKKVLKFCLTVKSFKLFKGGCKKGVFFTGKVEDDVKLHNHR